jgi:hypothetical protein
VKQRNQTAHQAFIQAEDEVLQALDPECDSECVGSVMSKTMNRPIPLIVRRGSNKREGIDSRDEPPKRCCVFNLVEASTSLESVCINTAKVDTQVLSGSSVMDWIEENHDSHVQTVFRRADHVKNLNLTNSVVASVPGLGDCGFDSVNVALVAAGVLFPEGSAGLRVSTMNAMDAAFKSTDSGLKPIRPSSQGEEMSFLALFQSNTKFGSMHVADQTEAQRIASSVVNAAKWAKYHEDEKKYQKQMEGYKEKLAVHIMKGKKSKAATKPEKVHRKPPESTVKGFVTPDCQNGDKCHKAATKAFRAYLTKSRKRTTWLDGFMLNFLADVVKREIHVYSVETCSWTIYVPIHNHEAQESVYLILNVIHYAPIIKADVLNRKAWELL